MAKRSAVARRLAKQLYRYLRYDVPFYAVPPKLPPPQPGTKAYARMQQRNDIGATSLTIREHVDVLRKTFSAYAATWRPPQDYDADDDSTSNASAGKKYQGANNDHEDGNGRYDFGDGRSASDTGETASNARLEIGPRLRDALKRRMQSYRDGLRAFASAYGEGYAAGHERPIFMDDDTPDEDSKRQDEAAHESGREQSHEHEQTQQSSVRGKSR